MSEVYAVFADARSIQNYIFSSNKLKLALGASTIVKDAYENLLKKSVEAIFNNSSYTLDTWEKEPGTINILKNSVEFEVGYIGGGNTLLFFKSEEKAKQFIKEWTKTLIKEAPGLKISVICKKINIDDKGNLDNAGLTPLYADMEIEKRSFMPITTLSKYGFTTDCRYTGLSAETVHCTEENKLEFISSVAATKFAAAENYKEIVEVQKYSFPKDIEKLGQRFGESHIAVVHIDGNRIGNLFESVNDIPSLRNLSKAIKTRTESSYEALVKYIIEKKDFFNKEKNGFVLKKDENGNQSLPIRPILIGGDDITFITDGRLGVHFAEQFIRFFQSKDLEVEGVEKKKLSACAGVAIVKTKYPFYRAYRLADELCTNAKKKAHREEGKSYIDFYISYGGFSGTLEEIRKKYYTIEGHKKFYFGPYSIEKDNEPDKNISYLVEPDKSISYLVNGIQHFKTNWPRSKIKELRDVITQGEEASNLFVKNMEARNLHLPQVNNKTSVWHDEGDGTKSSPYFDMIELMEFYPLGLMGERRKK